VECAVTPVIVLLARGAARFDQRAWLALAALGLAACSPHDAEPEVWPLARVRLPSLSCQDAIVPAGACERDADCATRQRCALDPDEAHADRAVIALRCRAPVGGGDNRARCETGEECASGVCGLAGTCLAPCRADADCLPGQVCQPLEARVADGLAPLQACARVAALPRDVEVSATELKALPGAQLQTRTFSAAGQVAAFSLLGECGSNLRVTRLAERGTDHVLFDWTAQLEGRVQPNPMLGDGSLLTMLVPNNPRLGLATAYELSLTSDAASRLTLISAWRSKHGRILDLNVFFVGGSDALGLGPYDAGFAAVIERLARRYAEVGITLGEVQQFGIGGNLGSTLSELEVRTQTDARGRVIAQQVEGLARLFALSAGLDQGGLNVFLVRSMGPLLGISGATPGALGLHGSGLSGVAIALEPVGLEHADRALFHELGHQLGLFHTSESDGSSVEPLVDTPVCGAEHDLDGDGVVRASECDGFGADNLMFWEGVGDRLSSEQRAILARSLVLR
jgi:hypothetical protein